MNNIISQIPMTSPCHMPNKSWKLMLQSWLLLTMPVIFARAELPSDFGPSRHRIASAKSWVPSERYQWLPDGRLFVWIGKDYPLQARLLSPQTGKQDTLFVFNKVFQAAHPSHFQPRMDYVTPDGKSVISLLGPFIGTVKFYRNLSLDGYQMSVHPFKKHFIGTTFIAWEWTDAYHGWVMTGDFTYPRTASGFTAAHFDMAHPETPRMVEFDYVAVPAWIHDNVGPVSLMGVTATGEGVLGPWPGNFDQYPEWVKHHKFPLSLIDIDQGKREPTDYLISIPPQTAVNAYSVSPDARHIVWQLLFKKRHSLSGHTGLFQTDEIWVSNLDGSDMHRIAYQALHFDTDEEIRFPAWKDNQTVSFVLNKVLYTMPLRYQR